MATDMVQVSQKHSLDDMVGEVIRLCSDKGVPVVFALKTQQFSNFIRATGFAIGILSIEGVEQDFHELMQLVERARLPHRER